MRPTPTQDRSLPRRFADFETLVDAVEYAACGERGINFYSARGELTDALPYSEIRNRAVEIGRRLVSLGLNRGDRVALIAETTPDFVCFFLGCQYASVLPVPLPLPTSFGGRGGYVSQLALQMKSCAASAAIWPVAMADLLESATKDLDLVFHGTTGEFLEIDPGRATVRLPRRDDLAYLQYSSGSTRFPHGISVTHHSLLSNCQGIGRHGVGLIDTDRCVSWLPFYHDMGLVGTFLTSLTCQVSVDYIATEDFARRPLQWLKIISENRGSITYSPTFGYDICARRARGSVLEELDLSSMRVTGIGGDMIRPEVMRQFAETFAEAGFRQTAFVPSYGLAECTLAVSFMPVGKGIETDLVNEKVLAGESNGAHRGNGRVNGNGNGHGRHYGNGHSNGHSGNGLNGRYANGNGAARYRAVVNCGAPLPDYEIEVRAADGESLDDRAIGRIFVRGPSVMNGYFNDLAATESVLDEDGWLDTGDMGYMLNGSLYIVGRAKDMIIVNGKNHWPQDIEWAVEQLPGMRNGDIAAISAPGADAEEVPMVLVQCRQRDPELRDALIQQVKQKVRQATGIACEVELVPPRTLPRTSSGKLSRSKARAAFLSGGLSPAVS